MVSEVTKPKKTVGLVIMTISLILALLIFYFGEKNGWSKASIIALICAIFAFIVTLLYSFVSFRKRVIPLSRRRVGVVVNYGALVIFLICFYWAAISGLNTSLAVIGIVTFILIIFSFIFIHLKTRLWQLTHSKIEKLDERELQVTHEALRYSYGFFSVICLSIFLVYEVIKEYSNHLIDLPLMPLVAALIYLVHTFPASILAWTEKDV
jgi:hypothetical protein